MKTMSDEVNLIQAWIAQGQQTDDGGIPIPPRMDEAAIARVRTRLFGPGATPTGEPMDRVRAMLAEAKTWGWLGLSLDVNDETVLNRLAKRAGALVVANNSAERRGKERDEARSRIAEVEAERDTEEERASTENMRAVAAERREQEERARAEQAERDREQIREAWSEVTADHNRIKATADAISGDDYWGWLGDGDDDLETMSDGMQVRITAGCLRGVIEEAKAEPTPLPEGARASVSDDAVFSPDEHSVHFEVSMVVDGDPAEFASRAHAWLAAVLYRAKDA